jgi:hypothetical protein
MTYPENGPEEHLFSKGKPVYRHVGARSKKEQLASARISRGQAFWK